MKQSYNGNETARWRRQIYNEIVTDMHNYNEMYIEIVTDRRRGQIYIASEGVTYKAFLTKNLFFQI